MTSLRVEELRKSFGAINALSGVSLELQPGEVMGLVGDNGAGKSTLIKTIAGVFPPDSGNLWLDGEPVAFSSPAEARRIGIETVYQDLALADNLSVAGNLFLGKELVQQGGLWRRLRVLRERAMRRETRRSISALRVSIPGGVTRRVRELSGGQRQAVAMAKAAMWKRKLLLLDEPTAALGVEQSAEVLTLIKRVAEEQSIPMIIVSHNLLHVMDVSDRIVVLRQGSKVADLATADTTAEEIVGFITGASG